MELFQVGRQRCECVLESREPKFVVVTGSPGAGKKEVLGLALRSFCSQVAVLPRSAASIFGTEFPCHFTDSGRRSALRSVYWAQRRLERSIAQDGRVAVVLSDRGTVDGSAFWPEDPKDYWSGIGSTLEKEMARYAAVIHLGAPKISSRRDRNSQAGDSSGPAMLDRRAEGVWDLHPNWSSVSSRTDFQAKVMAALEIIRTELPECCHSDLPHEGESVVEEAPS